MVSDSTWKFTFKIPLCVTFWRSNKEADLQLPEKAMKENPPPYSSGTFFLTLQPEAPSVPYCLQRQLGESSCFPLSQILKRLAETVKKKNATKFIFETCSYFSQKNVFMFICNGFIFLMN